MQKIVLLLSMIFCHIVDDYYLQGWLASAKQKKWWEENAPAKLYKHDYIIALAEHAFSWTFMIHIPLFIIMILSNQYINTSPFIEIFIFNWFVHAVTDDEKANKKTINLITDQIIHIIQIFITWIIYISIRVRKISL